MKFFPFVVGLSVFFFVTAGKAAPTPTAAPLVGTVTVQVTSKPANTFIPAKVFGAGVDGLEKGDVAQVYTAANIRAMSSVGYGPLTYRLRTELGVEAWHWNPQGRWTDPGHAQGYWTSDDTSGSPLLLGHGYRLPRRGSTTDQANNDGFSRLDDGDLHTFWKSNPYLDSHFTGEPNAAHPQWVVVDLGARRRVDTLRIAWAVPYAIRYRVQYWPDQDTPDGELDQTFDDEARWQTFPQGVAEHGAGGDVRLRLSSAPVRARFVRLWMMDSSETAPLGSRDVRDRCGYAISEIGLGTTDRAGLFHDRIRHKASHGGQTAIYASSTDPWHQATGRDPNVEQPGFDRVFRSALPHGLPVLVPVGLLYDTPENAAAEVRYLQGRGYPIRGVEMGEEPDGQYMTPEDYGALFVQWAVALHRIDPTLKLGGPCFQTNIDAWTTWQDAHRNASWMNRFLRYLKRRHHLNDFRFFSFEWYPFDNVCAPPASQLRQEPILLAHTIRQLRRDGVPDTVPWLMTEYGYSAFAGQVEMEMPGALLNDEIAAQFLTLGGSGAYLYGLEPNTPIHEVADCPTYGNLAVYLSDDERHIRCPLPTLYGERLLTQDWAMPLSSQQHQAYAATADVPAVTAYAVHRPDGQWAVLLLNKDSGRSARIAVRFRLRPDGPPVGLRGPVRMIQYSPAQYRWHPDRSRGYPKLDLPPVSRTLPGDVFSLPPYSLTVVRGCLVSPE